MLVLYLRKSKNLFKLLFSKDKHFIKYLRSILGFTPRDISVYKMAFQHKSITLDKSYERLEFLGDAVLDLIIAEYLYNFFPTKNEGYLTLMRTKIVNKDQLNEIAVLLGLDDYIKSNIRKQSLYHSVTGKVLEALIGAVYIDKGYEKTQKFIIKKIIDPYIDIRKLENTVIDYKSKIIEFAQKNKKNINFNATETEIVNGRKLFNVTISIDNKEIANASNISKKRAEQIVSKKAYSILVENII